MKSRKEIDKILNIPVWAESILDLHNIELYIFSEIYNTFRNELRSFEVYNYDDNTNSVTTYLARKLDYSDTVCSNTLRNLINKQYITYKERGTVYQTIKSYLPNIPYIMDILINKGVDEKEFIYKITLDNSNYTISAKSLYDSENLNIININRKGTFTIDLGLQDDLDIRGLDLFIISDMLRLADYTNSYQISEELKIVTGLTENELAEHLNSLCDKNIIFKDVFSNDTYHINFELYKILRYANYRYYNDLQKAGADNE